MAECLMHVWCDLEGPEEGLEDDIVLKESQELDSEDRAGPKQTALLNLEVRIWRRSECCLDSGILG